MDKNSEITFFCQNGRKQRNRLFPSKLTKTAKFIFSCFGHDLASVLLWAEPVPTWAKIGIKKKSHHAEKNLFSIWQQGRMALNFFQTWATATKTKSNPQTPHGACGQTQCKPYAKFTANAPPNWKPCARLIWHNSIERWWSNEYRNNTSKRASPNARCKTGKRLA